MFCHTTLRETQIYRGDIKIYRAPITHDITHSVSVRVKV